MGQLISVGLALVGQLIRLFSHNPDLLTVTEDEYNSEVVSDDETVKDDAIVSKPTPSAKRQQVTADDFLHTLMREGIINPGRPLRSPDKTAVTSGFLESLAQRGIFVGNITTTRQLDRPLPQAEFRRNWTNYTTIEPDRTSRKSNKRGRENHQEATDEDTTTRDPNWQVKDYESNDFPSRGKTLPGMGLYSPDEEWPAKEKYDNGQSVMNQETIVQEAVFRDPNWPITANYISHKVPRIGPTYPDMGVYVPEWPEKDFKNNVTEPETIVKEANFRDGNWQNTTNYTSHTLPRTAPAFPGTDVYVPKWPEKDFRNNILDQDTYLEEASYRDPNRHNTTNYVSNYWQNKGMTDPATNIRLLDLPATPFVSQNYAKNNVITEPIKSLSKSYVEVTENDYEYNMGKKAVTGQGKSSRKTNKSNASYEYDKSFASKGTSRAGTSLRTHETGTKPSTVDSFVSGMKNLGVLKPDGSLPKRSKAATADDFLGVLSSVGLIEPERSFSKKNSPIRVDDFIDKLSSQDLLGNSVSQVRGQTQINPNRHTSGSNNSQNARKENDPETMSNFAMKCLRKADDFLNMLMGKRILNSDVSSHRIEDVQTSSSDFNQSTKEERMRREKMTSGGSLAPNVGLRSKNRTTTADDFVNKLASAGILEPDTSREVRTKENTMTGQEFVRKLMRKGVIEPEMDEDKKNTLATAVDSVFQEMENRMKTKHSVTEIWSKKDYASGSRQ